MKISDTQKQIIGYAIALLILVITSIATSYGIVIPELKAALGAQQDDGFAVRGLQIQRFQSPVRFQQNATVDGALTVNGAQSNASTLAVTGATTLGSATITTGTVTALILGGQTQSGATRFGTTSVISGTTIAHGFSVTPTVFIPVPIFNGGVFTQTVYPLGPTPCNTISCTVGFSTGSITTTSIYWIAGK